MILVSLMIAKFARDASGKVRRTSESGHEMAPPVLAWTSGHAHDRDQSDHDDQRGDHISRLAGHPTQLAAQARRAPAAAPGVGHARISLAICWMLDSGLVTIQ